MSESDEKTRAWRKLRKRFERRKMLTELPELKFGRWEWIWNDVPHHSYDGACIEPGETRIAWYTTNYNPPGTGGGLYQSFETFWEEGCPHQEDPPLKILGSIFAVVRYLNAQNISLDPGGLDA